MTRSGGNYSSGLRTWSRLRKGSELRQACAYIALQLRESGIVHGAELAQQFRCIVKARYARGIKILTLLDVSKCSGSR